MTIKLATALAGLTAAILLSGCVTSMPIVTPSGQKGFSLNCSSMGDIGQCYKKAGELCGGNGYEVFDKNNHTAGFFTASNQTMIVRCKAAGEAADK